MANKNIRLLLKALALGAIAIIVVVLSSCGQAKHPGYEKTHKALSTMIEEAPADYMEWVCIEARSMPDGYRDGAIALIPSDHDEWSVDAAEDILTEVCENEYPAGS